MDHELWPKLVRSKNGMDVLPCGELRPGFRLEGAHIRYLLEFARPPSLACIDPGATGRSAHR